MATVIIESTFSHWIDVRGYNYPVESGSTSFGQSSYGTSEATRIYWPRNAFSIFPKVDGTVIAGKIEFYMFFYLSDKSGERFQAYDMSSSISDLLGSHTIDSELGLRPHIFQDAQTGVLLGEAECLNDRPPTWGRIIQMDLTPAALEWLNGPATDSPFAIGVTVMDLAPKGYVSLSFSTVPELAPRLVLEVVPEAGTFGMLCLGVAVLSIIRGRKRIVEKKS